jgi:hypothetical protein
LLLAVLFIFAVMIFVAMRLLLAKRRLSLRQFFILYALAMVGVAMMYLGITGKLHWLFVLVGSALPFASTLIRWGLRFWRTTALLKGLRGLMGSLGGHLGGLSGAQSGGQTRATNATGQTSEVNTDYIRMVLDHDTGEMYGEIVASRFAGSKLSELSITELKELYTLISDDADSVNVLAAYLDRQHPEWRASESGDTRDAISEQEALEILGLEPGASAADIKLAHRRIIQKLHPDRGGSTFLASQVNEAKDLLLKK